MQVSPPFGDFTLHQDRDTPIVLISAGVGQTPLLSMLSHLVQTGSTRPVCYVHAARNGKVHAMKQHMKQLRTQHAHIRGIVFYEHPLVGDILGEDYHHSGRIDLAAISPHVILDDADYYLCGPVGFMQHQKHTLQKLGVASDRIHYEVFGSNAMAG